MNSQVLARGMLALYCCLIACSPALSQIASDKADAIAANHARRCYIDLADGRMKCSGAALRTLSAARKLLFPGKLVNSFDADNCKLNRTVYAYAWRAFPERSPLFVDVETGEVVHCNP